MRFCKRVLFFLLLVFAVASNVEGAAQKTRLARRIVFDQQTGEVREARPIQTDGNAPFSPLYRFPETGEGPWIEEKNPPSEHASANFLRH
mmetsp:Transcript_29897/g.77177  ORF Transcript_29897/g.77177 Transcript_29897/m.77177 type:complete len:90 (+) Transcript_29897:150-419(+)